MSLNKSKKGYYIFLSLGIIATVIGLGFVFASGYLSENDPHLAELGIPLTPQWIPSDSSTPAPDDDPIFVNATINLRTIDMFAVRNPVNFELHVYVKNPEIVTKIEMINFMSPTDLGTIESVNPSLVTFAEANHHNYSLNTYENNFFWINDTLTPNTVGIMSFVVIANTTQDQTNKAFNLESIQISSTTDRIQLNATRASLYQTQSQGKISWIVTGLSIMLLAFLPFEFAYHSRQDKSGSSSPVKENLATNPWNCDWFPQKILYP